MTELARFIVQVITVIKKPSLDNQLQISRKSQVDMLVE